MPAIGRCRWRSAGWTSRQTCSGWANPRSRTRPSSARDVLTGQLVADARHRGLRQEHLPAGRQPAEPPAQRCTSSPNSPSGVAVTSPTWTALRTATGSPAGHGSCAIRSFTSSAAATARDANQTGRALSPSPWLVETCPTVLAGGQHDQFGNSPERGDACVPLSDQQARGRLDISEQQGDLAGLHGATSTAASRPRISRLGACQFDVSTVSYRKHRVTWPMCPGGVGTHRDLAVCGASPSDWCSPRLSSSRRARRRLRRPRRSR